MNTLDQGGTDMNRLRPINFSGRFPKTHVYNAKNAIRPYSFNTLNTVEYRPKNQERVVRNRINQLNPYGNNMHVPSRLYNTRCETIVNKDLSNARYAPVQFVSNKAYTDNTSGLAGVRYTR